MHLPTQAEFFVGDIRNILMLFTFYVFFDATASWRLSNNRTQLKVSMGPLKILWFNRRKEAMRSAPLADAASQSAVRLGEKSVLPIRVWCRRVPAPSGSTLEASSGGRDVVNGLRLHRFPPSPARLSLHAPFQLETQGGHGGCEPLVRGPGDRSRIGRRC